MRNTISIFFVSFLFAYDGGLLKIIMPPGLSIHTAQLFLGFLGVISSFNAKYFLHGLRVNKKVLFIFFCNAMYFQYHKSVLTPEYADYKTQLLWWNFAAVILLVVSMKKLMHYNILLLFGCLQICISLLTGNINSSSFSESIGDSIVSGRMAGIIICFAIFCNNTKISYYRYVIGLVGSIYVLLSGTRTVFIAIAIIVAIMPFYDIFTGKLTNINASLFRKLTVLAIGVVIVIVILHFNLLGLDTILVDRFFDAFSSLNGFAEHDGSTSERVLEWDIALSDWKKEPLIGMGFGSFAYSFFGLDIRMYPHNIIMELLSEGGVFGLLLFSWLVISVWGTLKSNLQLTPIYINKFLISIFLLGLISAQSSLEIPNQFIFFLTVGLILNLNSINKLRKFPVSAFRKNDQHL